MTIAPDGRRLLRVEARNAETPVESKPPWIRVRARTGPQFSEVLTRARAAGLITKSNLILGLGEETAEIRAALLDLHEAGCVIITITQYLRPSVRHYPVQRWVKPEEFSKCAADAERIGFSGVMAGPLVRSSYRARRLYTQALAQRGELLTGQ